MDINLIRTYHPFLKIEKVGNKCQIRNIEGLQKIVDLDEEGVYRACYELTEADVQAGWHVLLSSMSYQFIETKHGKLTYECGHIKLHHPKKRPNDIWWINDMPKNTAFIIRHGSVQRYTKVAVNIPRIESWIEKRLGI